MTNPFSDSRVGQLIRFSDLSTTPLFDYVGTPQAVLDHLVASTFAMDDAAYATAVAGFSASLSRSADALLAEPAFAELVTRLPFVAGDRVVILGDSASADMLSWANLLAVVLEKAGRSDVTVLNRALSGRTTAEGISAFDLMAKYEPTWILIALGGNDIRRHGTTAGVRMATIDETERNLRELVRLTRVEAHARPVLVSPWRFDPSTVEANRARGQYWDTADVVPLLDAIRRVDPNAIDLYTALEGGPGYWLEDGVHPAEATQVALLRAVVAGLVALPAVAL